MAEPRVYIRNVMFEVEKWQIRNLLTEEWSLPDPLNIFLCKKGQWREGKMCSVFLTYATIDECRTVIRKLHGQYFCSQKPIAISLADPPPEKVHAPALAEASPKMNPEATFRVVAPRPGRPNAREHECLGRCTSNLCFCK